MSKVVYKKEEFNYETGEHKKSTVIRATKVSSEVFLRLYTRDISVLYGCSNAEKNILISLWDLKFVIWDTNEVVLNSQRRKEIVALLSISPNTLNCSISRLTKKNVLIRVGEKLYLNHHLFFFGTDLGRMTTAELTLQYFIEQPEIKNQDEVQ